MKHISIILALIMSLSSQLAAQDFNKGLVAHNLENYAPVTLPKVKSPFHCSHLLKEGFGE
ncbi:MAG: hypothetical protein ACJ0BV_05075 [Paracoccaceae bacterium]|jgi:hypothetical protein